MSVNVSLPNQEENVWKCGEKSISECFLNESLAGDDIDVFFLFSVKFNRFTHVYLRISNT